MSEDATGSGLGNLGGSTSRPAAGGVSGRAVAGGAATGTLPNGGASALGRLTRGVLPEHGHETPSTGGVIDYLRTAWGTAHLLPGADAHPEYATDAGLAAVQAALEAVYTEAEADDRFEQVARKGQPDGYAPLSAAGLLPTAHLPPLAINDTFVVASQAAMLALVAQPGDMAIRTDNGRTYVLAADPPATLGNWKEVLAAGQVQSVNGRTGVVSLAAADVGAAAVDHTHPSEESGQWRFQNNPAVADPGSGYLRSNTGALATATVLAISRTTQDGYDIPPPGFGLTAGDTIYLQDRDDSTKWVRYTALEPLARFATYATGAVAVTGSAGSLAHGTVCQVVFHLAGGGGGGAGGGGGVATDALWDAKGDLVAGTGADAAARLAVGTNGQLLSADSAQASGLAWVANPVTAHAALPDAHHAKAHDHTAADASGVLSNDEHDGYSQYVNLGADPSTPAANRIRLYSKDNGSGVSTLYYRSEDGAVYELPTLPTGGGNGSGAPANAGYVTLAAESKLSQEAVLGSAVIMSGAVASRPASGTAGRLYLGTDTDLVYRDTGSAWETFADRAAGGAGALPLTGGTLTGALTLQGATSATNVLQAKLAADTQPRFRFDASGKLEWGAGGSSAPDLSLVRSGGNLHLGGGAGTISFLPATTDVYFVGAPTARWQKGYFREVLLTAAGSYLEVGGTNAATAGAVRLLSAATVAWRNAANSGNLTLGMDGSDRLALAVGSGSLTTSATAGSASALPGVPATYLTVVVNGTAYKLAAWT